MTRDFPIILITAVFASQILVCSFLSGWRFSKARKKWREQYPPHEYPRLYPIAPQKLQWQGRLIMTLRLVIGVGAMLLVNRVLRAMPAPAMRSAELRSWRFTEFVSPLEIALGITASIPPIIIAVYFCFHLPAHHADRLLIMSGICALLLARMLYVLLTPVTLPRPDPYMSDADVFRARRTRWQMLFRVSALLGAYITFMQLWAAQAVHIDRLYVNAGVSILLQLYSFYIAHLVLHSMRRRDLTPYRAEAAQ